nr:unnamed protein product [Digitaria exilis]
MQQIRRPPERSGRLTKSSGSIWIKGEKKEGWKEKDLTFREGVMPALAPPQAERRRAPLEEDARRELEETPPLPKRGVLRKQQQQRGDLDL